MVTIQSPPPAPNLSIRNTNDVAYLKGDADTDGSVRFKFDTIGNINNIELRAGGVWNDTGLRFASSSIGLGHDMIISAVSSFLETTNPSGTIGFPRALIPHIEFREPGGTTEPAHMPIVDIVRTFEVFPGPQVGEKTGTVITQSLSVLPRRLLKQSVHQVGSFNSTADVQVTYYSGNDNTGGIINRINLPPSTMLNGQPLVIEYGEDFGFDGAVSIFLEFVSANSMALQTNVDGDLITQHVGHELQDLDILLEEFILTKNLDFIFTNSLDFMYPLRFPHIPTI